jgi:DNA-binding NtrC family response regulator
LTTSPSLQTRLASLLRGPRDVRVLATSDRRPEELAADGRYSTELLERVSAVHIDLPPLSRRREDVPLLAAQCLEDLAAESGQTKRTLSPEAMETLASAKWPGNVRQLRMVVRQVASLGAGPVITVEQVQEPRARPRSCQASTKLVMSSHGTISCNSFKLLREMSARRHGWRSGIARTSTNC